MTFQLADFQRTDENGNPMGPKVKSQNMPLPIPTLAFSHNFGLEDWVFGAGIFAPNTILQGWPETVSQNGAVVPSPTRYSLISMRGSVLSALAVGLAYKGIEGLSIGADVQVQMGRLKVKTMLPGCDYFACSFPEDPAYDALATLDLFPVVAFSGAVGFTYNLADLLLFGASVTFPYTLEGDAKLNVKVPSSPLFDNATVEGDKAHFALKFPWIYRVGGEIRPANWLRMEGSFVYEAWSVQKDIPVTPKDVTIKNIRGVGDYQIGPAPIQRNMQDTWSIRGGYEAFIPPDWMFANLNLVLRGGIAYEKGAFKTSSLTLLTLDTNKVNLSGGFGINIVDNLRFDTVGGWIFMWNDKVRDSEIYPPNAIRPEPSKRVAIGNGNYRPEAFYLGGGFVYTMDD
jgi:long-subunit fatty acid transport protein